MLYLLRLSLYDMKYVNVTNMHKPRNQEECKYFTTPAQAYFLCFDAVDPCLHGKKCGFFT